MNLRMPEPDGDAVEWPLLSSGVHRHRDRHAGPQRREKKPVRIRSRISPSGGCRLVAREPMSSDRDLLRESFRAAMDDDGSLFQEVVFHGTRVSVLLALEGGLSSLRE